MTQQSYAPFRAGVKADTVRQFGRFSASLLLQALLTKRTFVPTLTLRCCQAVQSANGPARLLSPLCKLLHRWAIHRAGMDLSWKAVVGPGLRIDHGWGLVVTHGAKIGRNVTLFHGATLARRDRIAADGSRVTQYPELADEVWVGPHAVILGGVKIGKGSRIAGGAFVTMNVPPYSVVIGNPARVMMVAESSDVTNPA
jgi:serine O-acetyltransferase